MARPHIELDEDKIIELASKGLSQKQLAAIFNCSEDTLQRNYAVAIKTGWELRNGSLMQRQYEVAMSGNPTMLIWLGKQYLNQSDKESKPDTGENFGLGDSPRPTINHAAVPVQ
jgi:hypothetical protein